MAWESTFFVVSVDLQCLLDMVDADDFGGDHDGSDSCSSENVSDEVEWAVKNQHLQLHCLFQIMYYQLFHGDRKKQLHAM